MDKIKVSVCMVTYNHERYIAQAVKSVLAQQTSFPIELVIGEDCSTDRTREILLELARQNPRTIQLRLAERNQGGKNNFLGTIGACRGQYVAMLEGDDYWTCPYKLQWQVERLDSRPDWAMCFHPAACIYETGIGGPKTCPVGWTKPEAAIEDLFESNFIATSSAVFRNRLFPAFPAWFRELVVGDWPLHILNAEHGNIGFLPDIMSTYRAHSSGIWTGMTQVARMVEIFKMFTAIDHHFKGKYAAAIDQFRYNTVHYLTAQVNDEKSRKENVAADRAALESKYNQLRDRHRQLKSFHDLWTKSLSYRITRETHRLIRKIERFWRRPKRTEGESQSRTDDPASKAA